MADVKNVDGNVDGKGGWVIEGIEGVDDDVRHHMTAFYANLKA